MFLRETNKIPTTPLLKFWPSWRKVINQNSYKLQCIFCFVGRGKGGSVSEPLVTWCGVGERRILRRNFCRRLHARDIALTSIVASHLHARPPPNLAPTPSATAYQFFMAPCPVYLSIDCLNTQIVKHLPHLTFMGSSVVRIFQYISNKMQRYIVYYIWKLPAAIAVGSSNSLTNTRRCRYSCMRSWWRVEVPPETCRAVSRYNKLCNVASCRIYVGIFASLFLGNTEADVTISIQQPCSNYFTAKCLELFCVTFLLLIGISTRSCDCCYALTSHFKEITKATF